MEMKGDSTKLPELYLYVTGNEGIMELALKFLDPGSILNLKKKI